MTGTHYLAELALTPARFVQGKINVIDCPTGAGKTTFSLFHLPQFAQSNNCVLYITDTLMNKQQIVQNYEQTREYDEKWRKFMNKHTKAEIIQKSANAWGTQKAQITAMTYAKVGAILAHGNEFDWSKYDFIILDELHNLINFQNIPLNGNSANILSLAKSKIENTLYQYRDVSILALTATPDKVYKHFKNTYPVLSPHEKDSLFQYQTHNKIIYSDYSELLQMIPQGKKGIVYFTQIRTLKKAEKILTDNGHRAISLWSVSNTNHPMSNEQQQVRNHIIKHQLIPENIDILLINSSCETGVNIKNSNIDFMLIHSTDKDTITQVRGRLRHDLFLLYEYSPNYKKSVIMPVEYLNRPLSAAEKDFLCCEVLRVWNKKTNEPYKWKGTKEYLQGNGYKVTEKTINNKRTSTIELA